MLQLAREAAVHWMLIGAIAIGGGAVALLLLSQALAELVDGARWRWAWACGAMAWVAGAAGALVLLW